MGNRNSIPSIFALHGLLRESWRPLVRVTGLVGRLSRARLEVNKFCGNAVEKFGSLSGSWYAGSPHRIQAIGWTSGLVEQEVSTCCFGDSVTDSESRLEIQAAFIRHLNARTSQALLGICATSYPSRSAPLFDFSRTYETYEWIRDCPLFASPSIAYHGVQSVGSRQSAVTRSTSTRERIVLGGNPPTFPNPERLC